MIVVSACYGAYDTPKPPPTGADRCIAFGEVPDGWTRAPCDPAGSLPPRYRSKGPKATPQAYGLDDDDVLWIDASLLTTGRDVRELVELVPRGGVGAFRHRFRDCITDEAKASAAIRRYDGEDVVGQAAHYIERGHPRHGGLWETGVIVWRGAQRSLGVVWLAQMLAWSSQDQISFPYVAAALGPVTDLPGTSVENAWFQWQPHLKRDW